VSLTAKRISGKRAGLVAGLILALMPGVARYSQEGRVYALALAFAALSTWFLVEFTHGGRRRWIVAYAITLFFFAPIAPFGLTVIAGQAVLLLAIREYRNHLSIWLIALLGLSQRSLGYSRSILFPSSLSIFGLCDRHFH
jgi:mannosyltransferase